MKRIFTKLFYILAWMVFISLPEGLTAQCGAGETSHSYCYTSGEVNTVAFEVCPSAGMLVEADITQGTFDPFFPNTLTVYQGATGSGTGGTIVFGPTGGTPMGTFNDVSGNTITGTVADECLIFVINTVPVPGFDCATGTFLAVEACGRSLPATTVNLVLDTDEVCINGGVVTGIGGGTPTNGVYSGLGVTDDGNGMTFSFDPTVAGTGMETITYTMGGSATDAINVLAAPTFTALADLCQTDGVQTNLGGGAPAGGTYSGTGVTDNGNGTYNFNPGVAGLGVHTISYTTTCGTATDQVEVLDCGCTDPGLTSFYYCYDNFLANEVAFEICPTAGMAAQGTIISGTIEAGFDNLTVYEGASGSGTGGTPIFGPEDGNLAGNVISGSGANNCLIFVINSDNVFSCADGDQDVLQVCGEDIAPGVVVNFVPNPSTVCIEGGTVVIGGGTPAGGTYSGTGVTDDGNGTTFTFNPVTAGAGLEQVTYSIMDGGSAMANINVIAVMANMADPGMLFCPDDGPQFSSNLGTPAGLGGVYSGTGITDLGDGINFIFNPMAAGPGDHIITYTFTDGNGCSDSDQTTFTVAFPNVQFTAPNDLCVDAGLQAGLGGGTPVGGVYSGDGVVDDNNGMTYSFDPAAAAIGVTTITYTYVSPMNGCTASASDDVEVFPLPNVAFTALADLCLDAGVQIGLGGGTPTGGVYSGDGVVDDNNGMTYSFDPSMNGAGVGTHTITYTFTNGNGCTSSAADQVEVFDIPNVTFPGSFADVCRNEPQTGLGGGMPTGGVYSGMGVTDDGNGTTFSFDGEVAGLGTITIDYTFMDNNGCMNVAQNTITVVGTDVTFTAPNDVCVSEAVLENLMGGSPAPGNFSGPGVTDNLDGTYDFSPVGAGLGVHTITYTYTDNDGCTDTASDQIEVFGPPTISCPMDVTASNDPGQCDADVTVLAPTVTGGCFGTTVTNDYNGTADASDNYPVGETTVIFTVTDGSGNTATCSMTVTINDTEDPVISCPPGGTLSTDPGVCRVSTSQIDFGEPIFSDNCPDADYTVTIPPFFPVGTNVLIYRVTDASGNSAVCTQAFVVEDNESPVAVCKDATVSFNGEEEIDILEEDIYDDINSSDNCGITMVSFPPTTVTCDQIGSNEMIMLTVEDNNGNTGTCVATVTIDGFPCGFSFDPDGINCTDGSIADYDGGTDTYTITSEGCFDPAFYSANDLHGFIQTELCGDGEIIAEITDVSGNGWAGITMRETLLPGSKMLQLMIDGAFLTMRELRQSTGGIAYAHQFQTAGRNWLRLTRSENMFGAYHSTDGVNWSPVLITQIPMTTCIYTGLVTANKAGSGTVTGTFENVEVIGGVAPLVAPGAPEVVEFEPTYEPEVSIYPNPTTGEAFVDLGDYVGQKTNIRLFSSAGQLLQQLEIDEVQVPTQRLELNQYQNGLYLIQIEAEGYKTVTKKLTLIK